MKNLLQSEGRLYYGKWILKSIAMVMGLAVLGMVLHAIIIHFSVDEDLTVTYFGTFFAMIGSAGVGVLLSTSVHYRFKMLVTMGQKRGDIIGCEHIYMILITAMNYVLSLVVLLVESKSYPILYPGIPLDEEFFSAFRYFPLYSWIVILLLTVYCRFLVSLSEKYGMKVYTLGYLGFWVIVIAIGRILEMEQFSSVLVNVLLVLSRVPGFCWILLGSVCVVAIVYVCDRVLIQMNI